MDREKERERERKKVRLNQEKYETQLQRGVE